jgi:4-hydroxybenzoate polyprenyltransferase
MLALIRCAHPLPVAVVAAVSGALALGAGRGPSAVWVVLAVLAGQLFVGWSNDYADRDRDREAGRLDKPLAGGEIDAKVVLVAALAASAAAVPLSLASGLTAALVHFAGLAAATAYNLRLKATIFSAAAYAVGFGVLPAFITLGLSPPHWPPAWVLAAAALIGVGGHFAQARPDVELDRRQGVLGLPQLAGDRASAILAAMFLAGGAVVIAVGARSLLPLVALVPIPAVVLTRPATAYRLTLLIAVLTVAAFVVNGGSLAST